MKLQVIKDLVKVADSLDRKGLHKESDMVDALINKMAMNGTGDFSPRGGDYNEGKAAESAVLEAREKLLELLPEGMTIGELREIMEKISDETIKAFGDYEEAKEEYSLHNKGIEWLDDFEPAAGYEP